MPKGDTVSLDQTMLLEEDSGENPFQEVVSRQESCCVSDDEHPTNENRHTLGLRLFTYASSPKGNSTMASHSLTVRTHKD